MTHRPFLLLALALLLAAALGAQVQVKEINAMTVPNSVIDMDKVGKAGPTTEALVNLAGTNGGGSLARIIVKQSTTSVGIYNTNPQLGRALGRALSGNGLILVDPPSGQFGSFDCELHFAMDCTELGLAIGDYVGARTLSFYKDGKVVLSGFNTSSYSSPNMKYFQMTGGTFDRVDLGGGGNHVICEIATQIPPNRYTPYGVGCKGSNGIPLIRAKGNMQTKIGVPIQVEVLNMPLPASPGLMGLGTTGTSFGALGDLPFDLTPLGATGCRIWCSWFMFMGFASANGQGVWALGIPNDPVLVGARFFNQAYVTDKGANPFGLVLSNAAVGLIGK